jgi:hypothetical protein
MISSAVKPSLAKLRRSFPAPATPSLAWCSLNCEDSLDLRYQLTLFFNEIASTCQQLHETFDDLIEQD